MCNKYHRLFPISVLSAGNIFYCVKNMILCMSIKRRCLHMFMNGIYHGKYYSTHWFVKKEEINLCTLSLEESS